MEPISQPPPVVRRLFAHNPEREPVTLLGNRGADSLSGNDGNKMTGYTPEEVCAICVTARDHAALQAYVRVDLETAERVLTFLDSWIGRCHLQSGALSKEDFDDIWNSRPHRDITAVYQVNDAAYNFDIDKVALKEMTVNAAKVINWVGKQRKPGKVSDESATEGVNGQENGTVEQGGLLCNESDGSEEWHPSVLYPFVHFSSAFAHLRWLLHERYLQQSTEQDWSISFSENYNSLIEKSCFDVGPPLQRACINAILHYHSLSIAARTETALHFARRFDVESYFHEALLRLSAPTDDYLPTQASTEPLSTLEEYTLTESTAIRFIDQPSQLSLLRDALFRNAVVVGIDSEWVPKLGGIREVDVQTAILQLACEYQSDLDGDEGKERRTSESSTEADASTRTSRIIFVVDVWALNGDQELGKILQELFESETVLKIAYGFHADLSVLKKTIPSLNGGSVNNLLDYSKSEFKRPVAEGEKLAKADKGLSGLVAHYLGRRLSKKWQISDWERRPLATEQMIYAGADAHCLLDIHVALRSR